MSILEQKIDNPVWLSLHETHKKYALEYNGILFYKPKYYPFGGAIIVEKATNGIIRYSKLNSDFFVVGSKPLPSSFYTIKRELICNQMFFKKKVAITLNEEIVLIETEKQKKELYNLVSLVQPGYFNHKTVDLGRYYGIYKNKKLVSVTGERMKTFEFTEISAVVTHPQHTGNGYAKQLIKHITDLIFKDNKIPYLHVLETNVVAIKLYKKLGFSTKRKISFWNLSPTN